MRIYSLFRALLILESPKLYNHRPHALSMIKMVGIAHLQPCFLIVLVVSEEGAQVFNVWKSIASVVMLITVSFFLNCISQFLIIKRKITVNIDYVDSQF